VPFGPLGRPVEELADGPWLVLDGARTVRIRAVDADGAPLAGVRFGPWILGRADRDAPVNLSASFVASAVSGADGTAVIDWLPRETVAEAGATFLVRTPGLHWPDPPEDLFPLEQDREIVARLRPAVPLVGVARSPEGRPVSGLTVLAEGRGDTVHVGRAVGRTGLDGRYELPVAPEQTYTVTVVDDRWAATRQGVVVGDGPDPVEADLALTGALSVEGRMTRPDGAPVAGELVLLGIAPDAPPAEPTRLTGYWARIGGAVLQRATRTDQDGRYAFGVAPGDYLLAAVGAGPAGIHEPQRITAAADGGDVRVDLTKEAGVDVIGTSVAPYRLLAGAVYEYAFHPASAAASSSPERACMQCHRPHRSAGDAR
jgi:hypothetical protein